MMSTTHAAAGLLLAVPLAFVAPELAVVAAGAALVGGVLPDLDMVFAHRRTLHFPAFYTLGALVAGAVALVAPGPLTVAAAYLLLSAAVHCVSDVFGGGLEPRPWEATSDRGVYLHARGRWLRPLRLVSYDGSPGDLALAVLLAVPGLLVFDAPIRPVVVGMLVASVVYAAVRKRLPDLEERYLS